MRCGRKIWRFSERNTESCFTVSCNCYHRKTQYIPYYVSKSTSLWCLPTFLKHRFNLSRRFSIARQVICSLCFSSSMVLGLRDKNYTFEIPDKKQSQTERSGERSDHGTPPPRETICCGNTSPRTLADSLTVWAVAQSCRNHTAEKT
jgi:hypothetical protein